MVKINKKLKKQLPQTTAGLVRYYEEDVSKVQIDPKALLFVSLFIVVIVIAYRIFVI